MNQGSLKATLASVVTYLASRVTKTTYREQNPPRHRLRYYKLQ